jgi:ferrous iron transport protein B
MFFSLAFLEASGYMARAAFVMDRAMNVVGLQGQSFMPMILGFGCNVPAIYATRTIDNRAARLMTGLLIPFMSCSARLPVYVIFGLAFFAQRASIVIWGLYVLGVVVAAVVGVVLSRTIFRHAAAGAFVMEMPPYRWPAPRELWNYTWRQTAAFLRKAGTFILFVSVLFWLLLHLPWGVQRPEQSAFGRISQAIAPVFEPAGFGDWQASGALVTGVLAKEAVVASLSQLYVGDDNPSLNRAETSVLEDVKQIATGFVVATVDTGRALLDVITPGLSLAGEGTQAKDTALTTALARTFSPLAAVAFIVFVLLYVPCMATIGAQVQEFGWRWAGLSAAIMLVIPWIISVAIFQGGRLVGLG